MLHWFRARAENAETGKTVKIEKKITEAAVPGARTIPNTSGAAAGWQNGASCKSKQIQKSLGKVI